MKKNFIGTRDLAELMKDVMDGIGEVSLKTLNKEKIEQFLTTSSRIEMFTFQDRDDVIKMHFQAITGNTIKTINPVKKDKYVLLLAISQNSSQFISDLWFELGTAVRNLIIGDYRNIAKSLRWIIETLIFSIDLELNEKATDAFTHLSTQYKNQKLTSHSFKKEWSHSRDKFLIIFRERLKMRYEYGQPTFRTLVNNLSRIKMHIPKLPLIQDELKILHADFSSLIHTSVATLEQMNEPVRMDYGFFQSYDFNQAKFDKSLSDMWKVIDLVFSLIIIKEAHFFGYSNICDYISALKNFYGNDAFGLEIINNLQKYDKLPILKMILS